MNALIEASSKAYHERMMRWFEVALEEGIRFFVTSLGKPKWVVEKAHAVGGVVYHDVTERKWAEKGLESGVDGLIAAEPYKQAILDAGEDDIVLTERVSGVPLAVIRTPYVERLGTKAGPLARWMLRGRRRKKAMRTLYALWSGWKLKRASLDESGRRDFWQAGRSVAGIHSVRPVADIVREFADAAREG